MNKTQVTGAMLAVAVGALFAAHPLFAGDTSASQVKCVGGNSCKGLSSCKSANNSCKGQNSCKGKGWIMTPTAAACTATGGHVEAE